MSLRAALGDTHNAGVAKDIALVARVLERTCPSRTAGLETAFWERLPAPGHQRAWVPVYVTIASYLHDPLKISVSSPRTLLGSVRKSIGLRPSTKRKEDDRLSA